MKLAFSTLGCPGWSWDEIFATATDLGLRGIEIRGIEDEIYAPNARPFNKANIAHTKEQLAKANVEISMLTTGICLQAGDEAEIMKAADDYINLAQKLHVKYIRVMSTGKPQPEGEIDLIKTARNYSQLCDIASNKGVSPLIETNGRFADTAFAAKFIKDINKENAGILWDIHHPFRYYNEAPQVSAQNLKGIVKYVHVKDSVMSGDTVIYRMMGYGDVPVLDALKELKATGYDGFVSLEWVKRWNSDLEEPGIVFPHFANYMTFLLKQI
jgi:sugar phosphate isomerase/epimerase